LDENGFKLPSIKEVMEALFQEPEGEVGEKVFVCPPPTQKIEGDTARETPGAKKTTTAHKATRGG
jgi:hypothetical protein